MQINLLLFGEVFWHLFSGPQKDLKITHFQLDAVCQDIPLIVNRLMPKANY